MTDQIKAIESFLKDSPDWIKLVGVILIVWTVDRYGSMATDVEQIKKDVSMMTSSLLMVNNTLNSHGGRLDNLEDSREATEKSIKALESMTDAIWRRLEEHDRVVKE